MIRRPPRSTLLSLHDALPIFDQWRRERPDLDCSPMGVIGRISQLQREVHLAQRATFARHGLDVPSFDVLAALRRAGAPYQLTPTALMRTALDRKSTRLNSSHANISYAVFCLKKQE